MGIPISVHPERGIAMNLMMISAQWESSRHKTAHIGG